MIRPTTTPRRARLFGGAAMLLLVAGVVVAPLVAALSLCAMPCCHRASPSATLTHPMPCPGSECTIDASDDVAVIAPQATISISHAVAMAPAAVASAEVPVPLDAPIPNERPAPPDRPLHLVNSVFLI